jgi:hypothetical protein
MFTELAGPSECILSFSWESGIEIREHCDAFLF